MLEPDNTPTQPLPRIADTAPLSAIRASCAVPLPASLSPRGLAVDEPELPYQGDPPPLFGRAARAVLAALAFAMVACGLMIAFQVGQLSVPVAPFADGPTRQGSASPTPAPRKATPTTTPRREPVTQPTRVTDTTNDTVVPVVDTPVASPTTTPEATPTTTPSTPSTPSSEPSTPVTTAPATTQPPTSTAPVPTDQPTASAPAPEDLESTPPTE